MDYTPSSFTKQSLQGRDFSNQDLHQSSFAHSDITGANFSGSNLQKANFVMSKGSEVNFSGSDITNSTFEKSEEGVLKSLVGSLWYGSPVTAVTGWITNDEYWCYCTNAFVQIGCMQKCLAEWRLICQDLTTIAVLHDEQPSIDLQMSLDWWKRHETEIETACNSLV